MYAEVIIDTTDLWTWLNKSFAIKANTTTANTNVANDTVIIDPRYRNTDITSIVCTCASLANGTTLEVYSL
jgi:hypothetical protein